MQGATRFFHARISPDVLRPRIRRILEALPIADVSVQKRFLTLLRATFVRAFCSLLRALD